MASFDPYHQWLGIPPQEQPAHHYRLLGITDFEVDRGVISAAAERQTIYLRTLQAGEHEVLVAQLLNEVSQARVTLLNADEKAAYDKELRRQQTPEPVPEPAVAPTPAIQAPAPSPSPIVVRGTVTQEFPVSVVQSARKPRGRKPKEIWKRPAVIGVSVVGVIGVFVLFISQMSPGDAEPVASNTPGRFSAERAVEKADAEKAVTVTTALGKGDWQEVLALDPGNIEGLRLQDAAEEQAAEEQAAAEKAAAERAAAERAAAERAAAERAAAERAAAEKAAAEKAAAERAAAVKAAAEKAAAEKAAADKAAAVTAALGKRDWKTVLAIDADNIEGKQMQAAALEIIARAPIANRIGMKLKLIPAGTFMMGSPETEKNRGDGEHQHEVTISKAFYIQTTEVTQRQWRAVMGTEPWKGQELSKYVKEGPNYPVAYVSWDAAVAYCKILSQAVGKTYRLPTEAEWEYACRAGSPTAWSFGDDEKALGDYAWYKENASDIVSEQYAHQVGLKKPNAFGLYDMHGNVYEWCHDYYGGEYYKQSPEKDPTGPTSGSFPVLRGGAWLASTRDTRSARRDRGGAGGRRDSYGFRLVRELDSKEKAAAAAAALAKGDWKQALALDPDNSQGLRLKATAITAAITKGDWKTVLALDATNSDGLRLRAAAEKATILAGDPITNTIGMKLNLIPAGTFIMGSPEGEEGRRDNETQHKVTISKAFYMQTTEVTQGQWKAVMGTEPWKGEQYVKEGPNYPASYVSWDDAVAYCEKLSKLEGNRYRLPTEAEWEYACRAGTQTAWNFGDDEKELGDYASYVENADLAGESYAHQVRLKKPNAFGLYDMHGNVYEWCHDYYGKDYYKQSPEKDPTGPTSGSSRVLRGGSWDGSSRITRSANRGWDVAVSRHDYYGFRLVRELDDSTQSTPPPVPPTAPVTESITNTIGMKLNLIPSGSFLMGSPEGEPDRRDNETQHPVTISKPFYMQTTEVTQGQWKEVMGTEPWKGQPYVKEGPNNAASWVSWDDAMAYCKKLSWKEGKTYRLPTEAEWEYACRAGTKTTWSFGNDEKVLGDYAWHRENTWDIDEKYPHQVRLKKPNAFGLYDMHGNVWEWCHDYFEEDYYKQSPEMDPTGPTSGSGRVLRGWSWFNFARYTRSAGRDRHDAYYPDYRYGFRLVRELD